MPSEIFRYADHCGDEVVIKRYDDGEAMIRVYPKADELNNMSVLLTREAFQQLCDALPTEAGDRSQTARVDAIRMARTLYPDADAASLVVLADYILTGRPAP